MLLLVAFLISTAAAVGLWIRSSRHWPSAWVRMTFIAAVADRDRLRHRDRRRSFRRQLPLGISSLDAEATPAPRPLGGAALRGGPVVCVVGISDFTSTSVALDGDLRMHP